MSSFCICKSYSHFFSKYTCKLDFVLTITVNILTTNKLVKLTMLWTTGPWKTHFATIEPQRQKPYLQTWAPSEGSDQPAHFPNLIRIFTGRILDRQRYKVSSCGQRRLWSDWTNAQADLSLRWAHMSKVRFSRFVSFPFIHRLDPVSSD